MKKIVLLLIVLITCIMVFNLTACQDENESKEPCVHSFTHYVSDNNATYDADGTKTAFCDYGCGTSDTIVDVGSKLEPADPPIFVLNSNTIVSLTSYGDTLTKIIIPEVIDGVTITEIGQYAFCSNTHITSVEIPDSITTIGNYAFNACYSLTSMTIGNSVTSIGNSAFSGCDSLTSVTIGNSVTSIGDYAFYNCDNLTSIEIGNNVTSIGQSAFYNCTSLTSIIIPERVTTIGSLAFWNCTSIESIQITNNFNGLHAGTFNGCPIKTATIPASAINYIPKGVLKSVVITGGESIENQSFDGCASLTNVTIGDSITSIGNSAFADCTSLTSITMGDSVTSIDDQAFSNCSSLTSIEIPDSVTSIGQSAFEGCSSLTDIEIPYSVETLGRHLFANCSAMTNVILHNNVTCLDDGWFACCSSLACILIPNSVTSIGDEAFYNCSSLTSVEIPNSVTSIGERAFYYCDSLQSVTIGNSVTSIGDYAFSCCDSLTSVTMGDSITSIGNSAFYNCVSLTSIIIPYSVTYIDVQAFYGCRNLKIYCEQESQSNEWDIWWNFDSLPVFWSGEWKYDTNGTPIECCIITWQNWDGTVLEVDTLEYGSMPTFDGWIPTREANAQYTYSFAGWDKNIVTATRNTTYTAVFNNVVNEYTVTWKNWDGTTLKTDSIEYGETPSYTGAIPTRPSTSEYRYEFVGWDKTIVSVTNNITYTAVFNSIATKFTITWKNWDGTILEIDENISAGTIPSYNGVAPTRNNDSATLYIWKGEWSSPLEPVYSDKTFTAVFETIHAAEINTSNWRNYLYIRYGYSLVRSEYDPKYYDHINVNGVVENINANYEYMNITVTVSVTVQFYEIYEGEKYYRTKTEEHTFTINETGNGSYSFNVRDVYGMANGVNSFSMTLVDISGYAIKK